MLSFVRPSLLGTRKEFCNRFVNPITNGQHLDSTPADVRLMKRRAHVLHEMLAGCVQVLSSSSSSIIIITKHFYCAYYKKNACTLRLSISPWVGALSTGDVLATFWEEMASSALPGLLA